MCNKLITLSETQLEYLITKSVNEYLHQEFQCTVSDISSDNVGSEEDKLKFKVEIRCKEIVEH